MPYCTLTDLRKTADEPLLLRLADDTGLLNSLREEDYRPGVTPDEVIKAYETCLSTIAEATGRADSEIDSYLSDRYLIPLSPVSGLISGLSAGMTIYYLHFRRDGEITEKWQALYKSSVDTLTKISKGVMSLGAAANAMPEPSGSGEIIVAAPKPIFGQDIWRNY